MHNDINQRKINILFFFILSFFTIIMISIEMKLLWALEEDSDLIIHQEEEQQIIQHIQDKFIKNNQIKYQLEDITGSNNTLTEQDNKNIITYSLNNNDNIKKIMEIQEKDAAQKINKYIRQYFSDEAGHHKIKEEEYNVNKNIVRLEEIKGNTTERYQWTYDEYNILSTNIPPTVYSLITISNENNIKKEIEKSRALKNENGTIKINWVHMDNFNKVIVYEKLSKKETIKQRYFKDEIDKSTGKQKIDWSIMTYDKIIDQSNPNKEITKNRKFKDETDDNGKQKIDYEHNRTYDKIIDKSKPDKEIHQIRHLKDEIDESTEKQKINWSHFMTYDTIIDKTQPNQEITQSRHFKDGNYTEEERNNNIDWSNAYETIIDKTKPNEEITKNRKFKDETDDLTGKPKIDWSNSMTYNKIIDKTKPNQEITQYRHFKDEIDSDKKQKIDWSSFMTSDTIIDKTNPNEEITQSRRFKDGHYREEDKHNQIDWANNMTYDIIIDKTEHNKEITKSRRFKTGNYPETERNNNIDWASWMTCDTTMNKTKSNQEITRSRHFKNGNYTEEDRNNQIDWTNDMTYDEIIDQITGNYQKIRKTDFQTLFENSHEINLEPQYLNNNQKVKKALKNTLPLDSHELENIFQNLEIEQISDNEVQLKLKEVTDKFFPSQEPVILKSNYVASSSSNPTNNNVINNHSVSQTSITPQNNKEKKSFSLWLIIPSIIIIGVISYLVYLYINSKRP